MQTNGKQDNGMNENGVDSPSPSTIMQEVTVGIIKDPYTFDNVIHDKCPTPPKFSDEKRTTVDRFWKDAYLKSLYKTISHIQDWFTKISFRNKLIFTNRVIELLVDSRKLLDLAYFIGPPTKDWVYAHTQFTRTSYDIAAVDHNRAVEDSSYESESLHYVEWFQSLNHREQFDALVGLIHLGGTALEENIYGHVLKILEEKERDCIRQKVLEYLAQRRETGPKVIASNVAKLKQKYQQTSKLSKIIKPKSQSLTQHSKSVNEDEADNLTLLNDKIAEYDRLIKSMGRIRETSVGRSDRKRGSRSLTPISLLSAKKIDKVTAGVDRMQMLPLWANRKIIAMLPEKYTYDLPYVNKYWKNMVDKTLKEMKMRKKLNATTHTGSKHGKTHKTDRKGHKSVDYSDTKSFERPEDLVPEDFHEHLDVRVVLTEDPPKCNPFSNPHQMYEICKEYCDDRAMDVSKRWAAYSKKVDVEFCNVVFGVPCSIKLEDAHAMKISCVFFHPNDGSLLFTGGQDGLVKLHDIWKKTVKKVYAGHTGVVSDVVANCRYVASCGMDTTVRVFNIADGRSVMCLMEGRNMPCKLLMTNCTHPLLYVANMWGEVDLYSVRDMVGTQQLGRTVCAHRGEITSLNHYPCILLTTGVDGFARMWATNFQNPYWILSLEHPTRVNSAVMSHQKILSASEDGKLRIWDIFSGNCEKVLIVNPLGHPVLSMRCLQDRCSVKIVLNQDIDIRIFEFYFSKATGKKQWGRYKGSKLKPIGDFKKKMSSVRPVISSYDKRMMKLQMRQATLPPIRPSPEIDSPLLLQDLQKSFQTPLERSGNEQSSADKGPATQINQPNGGQPFK